MSSQFQLKVEVLHSAIDSRRGIARIPRLCLISMGAKAYSPISITGARMTAALAGHSPPRASNSTIYLDTLTCLNAGVQEGETVTVGRLDPPLATRIVLGVPTEVSLPDPDAVRRLLAGKVVTEGDRVSLLPQDFTRAEGNNNSPTSLVIEAVNHLRSIYGDNWKLLDLLVGRVTPGPVGLLNEDTDVVFTRAMPSAAPSAPFLPRLEDLGGLEHQRKLLEEWLTVSFQGNQMLGRMGLQPPDGVLIAGPPGSGKTSLVAAMAAHLGAGLTVVYGSHLASWGVSQAARYLRQTLSQIKAPPPQIVLIEDIDKLAPNPDSDERSNGLLPYLLDEIRNCNAMPKVAIVATAQDRSGVHPQLFGSGLLENELEIPVPRKPERMQILQVHTRSMPLAPDVSLSDIAERTAGFVGADLKLLCQKAAASAISAGNLSGPTPASVTHKDFIAALGQVRPSAAAWRQVEIGGVTFEDVGDMEDVKEALEECILWPLKFPETVRRYKLKSPRGILLFGPPGCGKTYVIRALANEAGAAFFPVRGPELLSKWVGESERAIRDLFAKAESAAPAIILLDEIDSLAPPRGRAVEGALDRVVGQLLSLLDGLDQLRDVWVVAATNRPDMVDPALIRPGRLERKVFVGPPNKAARLAILRTLTKHLPMTDDTDLEEIASKTEGYSSADLEAIVRNAMISAIKASSGDPVVDTKLLVATVDHTPPSLSAAVLAPFAEFMD